MNRRTAALARANRTTRASGAASDVAAPPAVCPVVPGAVDGICPTLPSSEGAYKIVTGAPGWQMILARDLAGRAVLCAAGIAVIGGVRDIRDLAKLGFASAVGIETFVLAWVAYQTRAARRLAAAQNDAAPAR